MRLPTWGSRPSWHVPPAWRVPAAREHRPGLLPARTVIRRPCGLALYELRNLWPWHGGRGQPSGPAELGGISLRTGRTWSTPVFQNSPIWTAWPPFWLFLARCRTRRALELSGLAAGHRVSGSGLDDDEADVHFPAARDNRTGKTAWLRHSGEVLATAYNRLLCWLWWLARRWLLSYNGESAQGLRHSGETARHPQGLSTVCAGWCRSGNGRAARPRWWVQRQAGSSRHLNSCGLCFVRSTLRCICSGQHSAPPGRPFNTWE